MIARSPISAWAARRRFVNRFIWLDRVQWLWRDGAEKELAEVEGLSDPLHLSDLVVSFLGGADEPIAWRLNRICGSERAVHLEPKPTEETLRTGTHITRQWIGDIQAQLRAWSNSAEFSLLNPPIVPTNDPSASRMLSVVNKTSRKTILVHPGSGGRQKCCPLEALESVVTELSDRGTRVNWIIGPDELERDGLKLQKRLERTCEVLFQESVERAADHIAAADAFLGNDAGMTHVAALAGIRTVALFGPTDPRVWRPIGPDVRVMPFPPNDRSIDDWVASVCHAITKDIS